MGASLRSMLRALALMGSALAWLEPMACANTPTPSAGTVPTARPIGGGPSDKALSHCPDGSRPTDRPVLVWERSAAGRISTIWMEPRLDGIAERHRVDAAVVATAEGLHVLRTRRTEVLICDVGHRCSIKGIVPNPACPRPKLALSQELIAVPITPRAKHASIVTVRPSQAGCPERDRSIASFDGKVELVGALGSTVYYTVELRERGGYEGQERTSRRREAYEVAGRAEGAVGHDEARLGAVWADWRECLSRPHDGELVSRGASPFGVGNRRQARGTETRQTGQPSRAPRASRHVGVVGISPVAIGLDPAQLFLEFSRVTTDWPSAPPFRSRQGQWCGFAGWECPAGHHCVFDPEVGCGRDDPGCAGRCERLPVSPKP